MKRIERILDDMGIKHKIESDHALIEFWTDAAGQDIPVEIYYDGTEIDFIHQFADYAENYDVDEQVELFVGMRGQNGVPGTVREIIDDCQEAKDTLTKIANRFLSLDHSGMTLEGMRTYRDEYACGAHVDDIATALMFNGCLPEECYDDLIEVIYQLQTNARNEYSSDYWRTFYNALAEMATHTEVA